MPEPLQFRRVPPAPPLRAFAFAFWLLVPPIALAVLWARGGVLAAEPTALDVAVHALVLLVPVGWAAAFVRRIRYLPTAGERVLGSTAFLSAFGASWWQSALLWPAPLLGLALLARRILEVATGTGPALRSTPGEILMLWLTTAALLIVWLTILRERAEIRISEEGLRTGSLHFIEWARLDHVVRRGDAFDLCHAANGRIPFSSIRLPDPGARAALLEQLARHRIAVTGSSSPTYHVLRVVIATAVVAQLAGGWALQGELGRRGANRLWPVVILFVLGFAATALLERFRGIRHITRLPPRVEPAVEPTQARGEGS